MSTADSFRAERQAVHRTLGQLGPDAPTLCGSWTTADMAAHLASETVGGAVILFLGRRVVSSGHRLNDLVDKRPVGAARDAALRRYKAKGFDWALERLAGDPPRLLCRPSVVAVSLFETWVHHEDVRRANGMGSDPERDHRELWDCVQFAARYQGRRRGRRSLAAVLPDGTNVVAGAGPDRVTVKGPVGEVLLWLAGRRAVADVDVEGDPGAIEAMESELRI